MSWHPFKTRNAVLSSRICIDSVGGTDRRDQLVPLQQAEGQDIKRRSDAFAEKVDSFVKFFQKRAPFALPDPDLTLEHVRHSTAHHHKRHCKCR